jgi:hypothetical protein
MTPMGLMAFVLGCMVFAGSEIADQSDGVVEIRGETYEVWPVEELVRRGLDVQKLSKEDNAAWLYIKAINRYEDVPSELQAALEYTARGWPGEDRGMGEYLNSASTREALELVEKAIRKERCQFPYFGDQEDSILMVLLPNLSACRHLGHLMRADGRFKEYSGDFDGALERYVGMMRVGGHVAQGITLIEALVGFSLWSSGADAIANMALRYDLPVETLERARRRLSELGALQPEVERGIESERTMACIVVDELCSRPSKFVQNLKSLTVVQGEGSDETYEWDINVNPRTGWELIEREVGRLLLPHRAIKKHINGYYDEMMDHLETPDQPFDAEGYLDRHVPEWDVVSRTLLPALSRVVDLERRNRAVTGLARSVVAIRLYEAQNRRLPSALADVGALLPESARRDPFSTEGLTFRARDDGWVVYSLSTNLVDDGGQEGEKWDSLDIVYRFPPAPLPEFRSE